MKASVIICYTNNDILNKMVSYLDSQDMREDFEIISIDNSNKKYSSAATALNYGASIAKGDILIFMHQDVFCENTNDISSIVNYFEDLKGLVLLGVAGYDNIDNVVCSNITETEEHIVRYEKVIHEPTQVETIDECLMAIRKVDFDMIKFDEEVCDNWHLYGVDLSYAIKLRGGRVYCVPTPICHLSKGNININFYKSLKKLAVKYKGILPRINSTCIQIENNKTLINKLIVKQRYWDFRSRCGKILRKIFMH